MKLSQLIYNTLLRLDSILPPLISQTDWSAKAFRFVRTGDKGTLTAIKSPHTFSPDKLLGIDIQKQTLLSNTTQFVAGKSANNILLSGARGTGKSSLAKSLIYQFSSNGLRLIEIDKHDLVSLPFLLEILTTRPEKFILFCDDLSFDDNDDCFKSLKRILDGGLANTTDNILVYATSNKRHLISEKLTDNNPDESQELFPQDIIEEKTSLSDRFGIWLHFYPFSQSQYLMAVSTWLEEYNLELDETTQKAALQWAGARGNRSGRVASQFVKDWAGKLPEDRKFIEH